MRRVFGVWLFCAVLFLSGVFGGSRGPDVEQYTTTETARERMRTAPASTEDTSPKPETYAVIIPDPSPEPRPEPRPSPSPKPSPDPSPKPKPKAVRVASGWATWYRWRVGEAAAGPVLRQALGPNWRGTKVRACRGIRCVTVKLTDWCACGDRKGVPTVIDLDYRSFSKLASPGWGVIKVVVVR